jgi:hypothetical protein
MSDGQSSNDVLDDARSLIDELAMLALEWRDFLLSDASNQDDFDNPMWGAIQRYEKTRQSKDCTRRLEVYQFDQVAAALREFYNVINGVFYPLSRQGISLESIDVKAARQRSLAAIEDVRQSSLETGDSIWRSQASVTEHLDALAAAASLADLVLEHTCDYLDYCEGAISVAYSHEEGSVESMQRVVSDFEALQVASVSAELRRLGVENTAAAIHDLFAAASAVMRAFDGGVWGAGLSEDLDPNSAASDLASKRDTLINQIRQQSVSSLKPEGERPR